MVILPRLALDIYRLQAVAIIALMVATVVFSACSPSHKGEVDELNSLSYAYHYRNLDSTRVLALRALALSDDYDEGFAEACNNLAFVDMAKMNYVGAKKWLDKVAETSDNQIELLVADVQQMRLCQRESRNKDFYVYREKAMHRLRRIGEEADNLPSRERHRVLYARSEFNIVAATYFYYVGLDEPMLKALDDLNEDELEQDSAQYLNYLYNYGSGGAIIHGTQEEVNQAEFDYLMRCYMLASSCNYPYWEAQALQALSEHLQKAHMRDFLIKNNLPAIHYLNEEQMPAKLLAGNLAQRALNLFKSYGDVYQTAGANRTLAECYWEIKDYRSAGNCLLQALSRKKLIGQAPDLVASIREQLCLVYSAMGDKPSSDYNRNVYLDLQENSRQDRQLEARAALLDQNSNLLNWMIAAVVAMIVLVLVFLYVFDRMRRRTSSDDSLEKLLEPLNQWKSDNERRINELNERKEELHEHRLIASLHIEENMRRNLEQRAKIALVNSITPFIDRMVNEVKRLSEGGESDEVRKERFDYISELTDQINRYNDVLTHWIQMRQGVLSLRVESFALQPLFDIVAKGKMSFSMKGVGLEVQPTDAIVKADRTLTLFMVNTIADNARKFTPNGGTVRIMAEEQADSVRITVADNGTGMGEATLAHVFDRTYTGGHGFGLLNCKGIIDKYRKMSTVFQVCSIGAESEPGKGTRISFTLPKGIRRIVVWTAFLFAAHNVGCQAVSRTYDQDKFVLDLRMASAYADSAYFSNINGKYARTVAFADSAIHCLNRHYLTLQPHGKDLMKLSPSVGEEAELKWFADSLLTDYSVILDIRNETAVAALALHDWALYRSNNKVYTQLFRERSADRTLPSYVRTMQVSENSKTVAVILLVLLLLQLPIAYYLLYYRHVLRRKFAVEKVNGINRVLLGGEADSVKLSHIRKLWHRGGSDKAYSRQLDEVVEQIEQALTHGIHTAHEEEQSIEMAEDELHRAEYESARLHVSNSVLDNCLSTLKHETMYYPSRIRQLIDSGENDVTAIGELVDYYKSIYTMLSAQAMEQVEGNVKYNKYLNHYLLNSLLTASHTVRKKVKENKGTAYSQVEMELTDVEYDAQQHAQLFTPLTSDMKYLLARQIVREIGEVTNLRGCGIQAVRSATGHLQINIVLPTRTVLEEEKKEQ